MQTVDKPAEPTWRVVYDPSQETVQALRRQLVAYNIAQARLDQGLEVAVLAQDEQGQLVAGVIGWMWGQCVEINYLWVQPDRRGRGYGRRLLQTIEAEAQRQGCHTAMLDTYTFQAPGFYQKFGYEVFGVVDGFPNGYQKLFLKKRLSVRGATDEQPRTSGK